MEVYLNDLSLQGVGGNLSANWQAVTGFVEMIDSLKPYGVQVIVVPDKSKDMQICGYRMADCHNAINNPLGEKRHVLVQLQKYFRELTPRFAVCDTWMEIPHCQGAKSFLLGTACCRRKPTVSFVFDPFFATSPLKGTLETDKWDADNEEIKHHSSRAEVVNLFDTNITNVKYLVHPSMSQMKNPLIEPLWNSDMAGQYLQDVGFTAQYITEHPSEKIAYLTQHGTAIAELNGWRMDENLSKKNSNAGQERVIFYSANFRQANVYLSIDFEKTEVYFELLNRRGKHQGEWKWDGNQSEDADKTGKHDIVI